MPYFLSEGAPKHLNDGSQENIANDGLTAISECPFAFIVKYSPLFYLKPRINLKVMELSQEAIEEFKRIYTEEVGEDISDEETRELGENLISLFKIIYRPLPRAKKKNQEESD